MDAEECDENAESEIERYEKPIECALWTGEKGIEDGRQGDHNGIHARSRAYEDPLPERGIGFFPVLEAGLRP